MTTFLIDSDNNIAAYAELPADASKADSFASEKDLAKLTKDWPASRLAEVWNGFAGAVPFDDLPPAPERYRRMFEEALLAPRHTWVPPASIPVVFEARASA